MEISGKVLREVEFRDRLRGYDTDEVDEFLEKVAVAVDELRAEMARLTERAARAEQAPPEVAPPPPPAPPPAPNEYALDDDAIRRTLVLAQRTADLAIAEAREEAGKILAEARGEAETLVGQAEEHARRTRDDAEQDLHTRIAQLGTERERLEGEVATLARLVESERARLTEALSSALQLVGDTLTVSEQLGGRRAEPSTGDRRSDNPADPAELDQAAPPAGGPALGAEQGTALPDVEAEIAEDAASAYGGSFPGPSTGKVRPLPGEGEEAPAEELWQRWAHGRDLGLVPDPPDLPGPGGLPGPSGGGLSA
ncbi:MAG: DivIVA domain-containing protein [Actinomycetota bacterium]|nr:DivIVA domain-containing protein [Actinomycetota bacterium]